MAVVGAVAASGLLTAAASAAPNVAAAMFADDFEHGSLAHWRPSAQSAGRWSIVAEPGKPDNHVLATTIRGGGTRTIDFGDLKWSDYKLTAHFKVIDYQGSGFHVKLACRNGPDRNNFCLNARSTGPALIHNVDHKNLQLGLIGSERIEPGRWYLVSLQCAGPLLTARVADGESGNLLGQLRCYEESGRRGACYLQVVMLQGAGTFLFDDVRVEAAAAAPPEAGKVVLENRAVRVEFDKALGRFDLVDLRRQQRWPQTTHGAVPQVISVERAADGLSLVARLETPAGLVDAALRLEGAEVLVALRPVGPGQAAAVDYPLPWLPPATDAELVIPADEGVILPVTGVDIPRPVGSYSYHQSGTIMPWMGLVEGQAGAMALVETGDDFRFDVCCEPGTAGGKAMLSPGVHWLPSRDDLRYERRVRYCLLADGGYVAMAKGYRKFLVDTGRFRTLAEKAGAIPDVAKLLGAIDIYDHAKNDVVLDWMIAHGIRRALYYGSTDKARNDKVLAAGYVTGRYDIYTDIATPELLAIWGSPRGPLDRLRIGYPDEAFVRRDGSVQLGFPYPVHSRKGALPAGEKLKTVQCASRCSSAKLAWVKKIVPAEAAAQSLHARFMDVETASPLSECYSKQHALTRTEDRQTRTALFDYLHGIGQVSASEGGADWCAQALDYQEGSLTLNYFAHLKGVYVGTSPIDLTDDYIAWQFNMARRVPLHKLVYHDSLLMTCAGNHTPNRWVKGRRVLDDWDLLHILYGGMPIFVVDAKSIELKGDRILQTYRNVCGVLEKIAGSEMLSHHFVTPDRLVQETRFANGYAIMVNFDHTRPHTSADGAELSPKSFALRRWK